MRIQTFVVGSVLALAIFLFAQRRADVDQPQAGEFRSVVDLTRSVAVTRSGDPGTRLEAPAGFAPSLWTADKIPAERLIAPLVILDVRAQAMDNADYQVSMDDVARFEHANGHIPQGAVVMARTGWTARGASSGHRPGYSEDAAKFLVEARNVLGLGIDAPAADSGPAAKYTLSHSVYELENVANLDLVPTSGALVVVAPMKFADRAEAPVRIFALVR